MRIVFAGNCQSYALFFLFERHFAELGHELAWVDAWNEHRLEEWRALLAGADLVANQVFSWPTRVPVTTLCGDVPRVDFPDVRGNFLWPYGNVPRIDNPSPPYKSGGPYDTEVGDSYLNRLVEQGVPPEAALRRYLEADIVADTHLDRLFELTMEQQRARDRRTGFEIADHIAAGFREERLFNTQGHLSLGLFLRLAGELYARLGASDGQIADFAQHLDRAPFEPYHDAPVHPQVIAHYRLTCIDGATRYHHVQEGSFTFAERVIRYMENAWSPELHEGCALADRALFEPALELLERGLAHAPRSAHGHSRKGDVLRRLGRYAEAVVAGEIAVALEPDDREFAHRLGQARAAAGGVQ